MGGFPRGQRGQTVNLLATLSKVRILLHPLGESRCADQGSKLNGCYQPADVAQLAEQLICNQQVIGSSPIIGFYFYIDAGWSSLEARRAHNPKVIGSNPIPATYAQIAQLVMPKLPHIKTENGSLSCFFYVFKEVVRRARQRTIPCLSVDFFADSCIIRKERESYLTFISHLKRSCYGFTDCG